MSLLFSFLLRLLGGQTPRTSQELSLPYLWALRGASLTSFPKLYRQAAELTTETALGLIWTNTAFLVDASGCNSQGETCIQLPVCVSLIVCTTYWGREDFQARGLKLRTFLDSIHKPGNTGLCRLVRQLSRGTQT